MKYNESEIKNNKTFATGAAQKMDELKSEALYIGRCLESGDFEVTYAINVLTNGATVDIEFREHLSERWSDRLRMVIKTGSTISRRFDVGRGNVLMRQFHCDLVEYPMPEKVEALFAALRADGANSYREAEKLAALKKESEDWKAHQRAMVASGRAEFEDEIL